MPPFMIMLLGVDSNIHKKNNNYFNGCCVQHRTTEHFGMHVQNVREIDMFYSIFEFQ